MSSEPQLWRVGDVEPGSECPVLLIRAFEHYFLAWHMSEKGMLPHAGGWALIGHPFWSSVPLGDCYVYNPDLPPDPGDPLPGKPVADAVALGWIGLPLWAWSPSQMGYSTIWVNPDDGEYHLQPWRGYWINASVPDLALIVPVL